MAAGAAKKRIGVLGVAALVAVGAGACKESSRESSSEKAGREAREAYEKSRELLKEGLDKTRDLTKEGLQKGGEAAKEGLEKSQEAAKDFQKGWKEGGK